MPLVHVKDTLNGLFEKLKISGEKQEIFDNWEKSAGSFSEHAQIVRINDTEIVVNVDNSVYLQEMLMRKNEILDKLNLKLKGGRIKDIKFKMGKI
jgi:predicted nucleic acid-binding Zn ribbon protein